ncbi:MAG: hypothetical protein KAS32_07080 [Candidatus Peribacteraceae bacterium]|nr:hypothetical protein [Candidatus Peribacteraceae bacterium]
MKIVKSIPRDVIPKTNKDGILFEAIDRYIKKRKYPKSLVSKKLDLAHKKATQDVRRLNELNAQVDVEIAEKRKLVIALNTKSVQLIQKLQKSI